MSRLLAFTASCAITGLAACSSSPKAETVPAPTTSTRPATPTPAPATATPAPSTSPVFHPSRLVAGKDSFVAVAGGQVIGGATLVLNREGANIRYAAELAVPAMNVRQRYEVLFDATSLMPISQTVTGSVQGIPMNTNITIANGRAKGSAQDLGPAGIKSSTVDLAVPPGTIDDQAGGALITTLDLVEGLKMSFTSLGASPAEVSTSSMVVGAKATITVPAGTFETYRIVIHQKDDDVMYVTTAVPRRIVLILVENGQVELRLVK